jgi:hypothetical protein
MRTEDTPMSAKTSKCGWLATLAAAVVIVGGLSAPARADDDRLDEAWADAVGGQEPILTDKQFAMLNNLAFQAAVTKICDGYELDQDKFAAGISEATTPPPPNMSTDDAEQWKTAVLIRFGTAYGVLLSEGNADVDNFCKSAADLKGATDVPNVWQ